MKIQTTLILVFSLILGASFAQPRIELATDKLEELAIENPGFNDPVEFSVNGTSIQELIRAIGLSHNLNLSVDPNITERISYNFSNARVIDVLLFLCKEYSLDISITGNIVNLKRANAFADARLLPSKTLEIEYQKEGDLLTLNLKGDSIDAVVKEITRRSGKNILVAPEMASRLVNIYVQNIPFENAADKLAYAAGLQLSKSPDGVYVLEKQEVQAQSINERGSGKSQKFAGRGRGLRGDNGIDVQVNPNGNLSIAADNSSVNQLIEVVSKQAGVHYFLYTPAKGEASLFVENISYVDFLDRLLAGSNLTYKFQDSVYLIGDRNFEGLRNTELVRLQNRTISQVKENIPQELKKEIELFEFKELNGLILSGSKPKIEEVKAFIKQVDKVVPLITIDVMIVDINTNRSTQTGISFGLGNTPTTTTIKGDAGLDITLSSKSINQLLSAFNGFGSINLGRVTPNFYASLQALETEGIIKTHSTPRLSTLNGNEATLSIGEMTYYLETTNNLIGTQNPTVTTAQNYKQVNADLTVTISPVVSGDDQVTLSIEVNQSDFTNKKISDTAPPGTLTRKFKSIIRVRNEEMVILGGLENNRIERSGSGLPLINRIPVIKYLFGRRVAAKSKAKLTLFIKPTIHFQ